MRVSESVGQNKEVSDTRGWSGFSFSDIAANRAGARFATSRPPRAIRRRVQEWMERAASDTDIMPEVHGLPDHLPEEELKRRFGEPGERAYEQVLEEIEALIAGRSAIPGIEMKRLTHALALAALAAALGAWAAPSAAQDLEVQGLERSSVHRRRENGSA